jgi:ATP-binding cassette subfamily C protein CydCD
VSRPLQAGLAGAAVARSLGIILLAEALARGIGLAGDADWPLVVLLAVLGGLLRGGASWVTPRLASRAAADIAASQRARLLRARLDSPSAQGDLADVTLAGRGMRDLTPYLSQFVPAAVNSAIVPVVLLIRVAFADWPSALVIAVTLPLVPVFMILIGRYTSHRTADLAQAIRTLTESVAELARGLAVLVSLGRARQQRRGLEQVSREYTAKVMQSLRVAFLSSLALELIATMSVALVAVVIGLRLLGGDVTLYAGLVALIIAPECYTPLREVGAAYHAAEDGQLALKRSNDVLASSGSARADVTGEGDAWRAEGDLHRGGRLLAPGLDLTIPGSPGITTIMGPSGSGKSTLLSLLSGGEDSQHPDAPRLDGAPITRVPSLMAPQAPAFTEDSVRAELSLYSDRDPEQITAALGLMPLLDAPTSDLSPGEQRRLSLARVLLAAEDRPGTAVLLDEPTSQLDTANADRVLGLLRSTGASRRVVVVTHDPRVADVADQNLTLVSVAHKTDAAEIDDDGAAAASPVIAGKRPAGAQGSADAATAPTPSLWREPKVLLGLLYGVIAAACAVALTALSGWLIVRASQQPAIMYLSVAIVGVRAFGLFRAVSRYAERLATHDGMLRYSSRLRLRLWDALASSPAHWRSIARQDGATSTLVSSVDAVRDAIPRALVPGVSAAFVSLASVVAFALVEPRLLWVPLMSVMVSGVGASWLAAVADRRATAVMSQHDSWLARRLGVLYRAAPDVAGGGAAPRAVSDFAAQDGAYGAALKRSAGSRGLGSLLVVGVQSLLAVVTVVRAHPGQPDGLALELTAALALLMVALIDPYSGLLDAVPQWRAWRENSGRITAAIAAGDQAPQLSLREQSVPLAGLGASDLVLSYQDGPVIGPVTLRAQPGEWTVITGPSGSGKSTVLDGLAGFKAADSGAVVAPNGPPSSSQWEPVTALGSVTWCPQDSYIFDAPVAANLRLARENATGDDVRRALQLVGLGSMDPERAAGPGGSWLSGGERQRLSVARGLLHGADVFLLDEPTAHLDHDSAVQLIRDLGAALRDKTVIVVAHGDFAPGNQMRTVRLS